MTFAKRLGSLLWGTPAYRYGSKAYKTAVESYIRVSPEQSLEVGDASAVFRPACFFEWNNLRNRIWDEREVLEHVLADVRPDDVFFDVGANIGIYSCLVDSLLTTGAVVPFEPYPPNIERLAVNLDANEIDATVQKRPLADGERTAEFYLYDSRSAGAQHGSLDTHYPTGDALDAFTVETVAGDTLVAEETVPAPTVLKIDVQGTGPDVIDGLRESLSADRCRLVYVESHDNVDTLRDQLRGLGFSVDTIDVAREGKDPTLVGYADSPNEA